MRVWCQDFYTEAHRTPERQFDLIQSFTKVGVTLTDVYDPTCDLAFCGSLFTSAAMRQTIGLRGMPSVFYNWDLYPHVIYNRPKMGWGKYLHDLRRCMVVVVPNEGTRRRTTEFTSRKPVVIRAPVKVWDVPEEPPGVVGINLPPPRTYALDVMRDYDWDAGFDTPELACRNAGIELVRTRTKRPWDEFRWLVANARCLISAVDEASTGGLTLLEGYAHGVPVVINDSILNGAGEYFGDRAYQFNHLRAVEDLSHIISDVWSAEAMTETDDSKAEKMRWVRTTFSDDRFAADLKGVFESCLTASNSRLT